MILVAHKINRFSPHYTALKVPQLSMDPSLISLGTADHLTRYWAQVNITSSDLCTLNTDHSDSM